MKYRRYLAVLTSIALMAASFPMTVFAENNTQTEISDHENSSSSKKDKPEKPQDKPDGEQPPAKPDGDHAPGEMPDGQPPKMPDGNGPEGMGGPGGADTQTYDYTGTLSGVITADGEKVSSEDTEVTAADKDQNALLAQNGGTLTVNSDTITKSGDDTDGDNCNFYGLNSIALSVGDDSLLTILNTTLTADSTGSNAVFATDNAQAYISSSTIKTTSDNSRGLDATYGGSILAGNVSIETSGDHSASIATDRGGGNISAENSTLHTEGSGSPLLYSTGIIEVNQVNGTAAGSQIAGMEGLNTILIEDSDLSSTITDKTASDPVANGVIIYQSTSGDAETSAGEKALFQAVDSTLTSAIASGSMFYVTNTVADVVLSRTTLDFDAEKANLLQIEGNNANNWGSAGSNGGTVTFSALGEVLSGNISVDSISSLDLYLLDSTTYTGTMAITKNTDAKTESLAPITVNLDATSTWIVTENCTISNLNADKQAQIIDMDGNIITIIANGETIVEGTSDLTVTVTNSYTNEVTTDTSNTVRDTVIDRTGYDALFTIEDSTQD